MKKLYVVFVILSVLFTATNISAQVSFSGKTDFTLGGGTNTLTTADINGDGKQDIIATRAWISQTVTVLLNTTSIGAATPTFSAATDFTIGGGNHSAIAVADLNGDGKLDIIASASFGNNVFVLLNTTPDGASTPSFSSYTSFTVGAGDWSVEIGDVNGDGKPDIVTANWSANTVSVLLNTTTNGASTPTFSSKTDFTVGQSPVSVSIGDVNGDGKPDIVTANQGASTVSVLLNTTSNGASTPTFTSKTDFAAGATTYSVIIGDVNGDYKPDIITANYSDNTASILLNTTSNGASTPTFSSKTDFAVGTSPVWVAIADLDGDGKSDVVTANQGANTVSVLLNTTAVGASTPTFSSKSDFGVGTSPGSVTDADINGDNKPDIITANTSGNTASVLLNTTDYIPLPVELTSFSAALNNSAVELNWETATEVNNYGFNVELRIANGEWKKIGFVQGHGNSNSPKEYSFTDSSPLAGKVQYRLKQIDFDGAYEYSDILTVNLITPNQNELLQNSPNPFNPSTTIKFNLAENSDVNIKIYDVLGKEVATLINQNSQAGYHIVYWNGKNVNGNNVASGIYLYTLTAGNFTVTKKMLLMK